MTYILLEISECPDILSNLLPSNCCRKFKMSNQVYLNYRDKAYQLKSFHYSTMLPFLWQEVLSIDLLEQQESRIETAFEEKEEAKNAKLIIPIEIAISNLSKMERAISSESQRKKTLRTEFLNFLKNEVAENTDLEIDFSELIQFYSHPKDLLTELIEFQSDHKKRFKYQREKVSFRSIGYNTDFEEFSTAYRFLVEEFKVQTEINSGRQQDLIENKKLKKEIKKKADFVFLLLVSLLLGISGILLLVLTLFMKTGIAILSVGLIIGIYLYFRKKN